MPGRVSYQGDAIYTQEQTGLPDGGYWSIQEVSSNTGKDAHNHLTHCQLQSSLSPACRVTPQNTLDVAAAVKILVTANVEFAVRGGGHTSFAGGRFELSRGP